MIDKENVAHREKRGEWRDRDDGGLGGVGAIPEGGDSLGAKYDGGVSGGDEGRPTGEMRGARGVGEGGLTEAREGSLLQRRETLWCRRGRLTVEMEDSLWVRWEGDRGAGEGG